MCPVKSISFFKFENHSSIKFVQKYASSWEAAKHLMIYVDVCIIVSILIVSSNGIITVHRPIKFIIAK